MLALARFDSSEYKDKMEDEFDNHKEPEENFLPLTEHEYAALYDMEMGHFTDDIRFYLDQCRQGGSVLELGCGEGRISRAFAADGFSVTGIDLSPFMLRRAGEKDCTNISYVCMDMKRLSFSKTFDHILIPYNTLNLLCTKDDIHKCLEMCRSLLNPGGSLLIQVHCLTPGTETEKSGKTFQFQMLPQRQGEEKIIKETLRSYLEQEKRIILEERYRFRPQKGMGIKRDLHHILHLAAFSAVQWQDLLQTHSFTNISLYADYRTTPYFDNPSSLLLIRAEP